MTETNETLIRKVALSARAIDKMKPETTKADIGEYEGLRVNCGKTGLKSFIYRYRSPVDQALKKMKIGTYPDMSLAHARVELLRLKAERRTGICPITKMKEQKSVAKLQAQNDAKQSDEKLTIKAMIELYLTEVIEDRYVKDDRTGLIKKITGSRKPKGQSETRRTIYGDAVKVLGDQVAENVTRKDVVNMVKAIIDRGANVQAGRVLSELSLAYEYAIGLEMFTDSFANPALLAKANFKQARAKLNSNKGTRVLSDKELREVLIWLPQSGFAQKQKAILKITLWTGCRTGEVCIAEWKNFDLNKKIWHIRESKNGAERHVQLPDQCVAFLSAMKIIGENGYMFESERTGKPIQQKTLTETKWRLKNPDKVTSQKFQSHQLWLSNIPDWNPHDLRRTVRTGLSRLGCPSDVAEAVLGHSKKGIEGTYNLHKYERECSEWLQKWSNHMDGLL
jgi:integrase